MKTLMARRRTFFLLLFLGIVFLLCSGCADLTNNDKQIINLTLVPTISLSPQTTETSSTIVTPTAQIKPCFSSVDLPLSQPLVTSLPGSLILKSGGIPFNYNFADNRIEDLPKSTYDFSVSADGKDFLYVQDSDNSPTGKWLVVVKEGEKTAQIPLTSDLETGFGSIYWLTDSLVALNKNVKVENIKLSRKEVLDTSTNKVRGLPLDLPDLKYANKGFPKKLFYSSDLVFDPTVTKVAYLGTLENGNQEFVVWDLKENKEIARIPSWWQDSTDPIWSFDGKEVYFPATILTPEEDYSEWYSVNINGSVSQLTHFSDMKDKPYVASAALSPDGGKIAFWWETVKRPSSENEIYSGWSLSILDTKSGSIINTCIPFTSWPTRPFWSPDSKNLAIDVVEREENGIKDNTLILNVEDRWQGILFGDTQVFGWRNK